MRFDRPFPVGSVAVRAWGCCVLAAVVWVAVGGRVVRGQPALHTITTCSACGVTDAHAADLTGDGRPDVLSASGSRSGDGTIAWYENQGDGEFAAPRMITTAVKRPTSVHAADLTGNGRSDVLVTTGGVLGSVLWFENEGSGQFSGRKTLWAAEQPEPARRVLTTDLTGNGRTDVLAISSAAVGWFENQGDGQFSGPMEIAAPEDPRDVFAADVDGNGTADVLAAVGGRNEVVGYENQGNGQFGPPVTIATGNGAVGSVYATDLTGDGRPEVLFGSEGGTIAWCEHRGADRFSAPTTMATMDEAVRQVDAADVNGDGRPDVVAASGSEERGRITWYENQGDGGFSPPRTVAAEARDVQALQPVDVGGEAGVDVLAALGGAGTVAWYEHRGRGRFYGPKTVSDVGARGVRRVYAADLNGNGRNDVLSASSADDKIAWYENRGDGQFSKQHVITTAADGARSVHAADVDGDGRVDVLSASAKDGRVVWYENQGGGRFAAPNAITTTATGASQVHAADLTGDGRPDVLTATRFYTDGYGSLSGRVAWYENQGGGRFSERKTIAAAPSNRVYTADLTGDGAPDVLSASATADTIAWYENEGGGRFSGPTMLPMKARGAASVYAADLTGNGKPDVLGAGGNTVRWYKNRGEGRFEAQPPITTEAYDVVADVYAADVTGDGALDVVFGTTGDNTRLAWQANGGDGTFSGSNRGIVGGGEYPSVHATDLNGDGVPDVLTAILDNTVAWVDGHMLTNAEAVD